jgi:hypothetical protein
MTSFADRIADLEVEPCDPTAGVVLAVLALEPDMALTDREREFLRHDRDAVAGEEAAGGACGSAPPWLA